jgi:hypothetical protein
MSAYKKLNKQDAYITTYNAHKPWALLGSQFSSYGITRASAGFEYLNSLRQLYYPEKTDGNIVSHSFDTYNQTTLFFSSSRNLATGSHIISIPRQIYGTNIQPKSLVLNISDLALQQQEPIDIGYVTLGYMQETPILVIEDPLLGRPPIWIEPDPILIESYTYQDDGEGNLYISGSIPRQNVGDIVYTHGMVMITDVSHASFIKSCLDNKFSRRNCSLLWQSSLPIFTHNYHCRVRDLEYNLTYNPSALSSSIKTVYDNVGNIYSTASAQNNGVINNNLTGSAFQPYITTVGLYNDANQLIAVGKMPRPVPKSANTEMTIIVKIDI